VWVLIAVFGVAFGGVQTFMRTFVDDVGIGTVGLFFACYSTTAVVLRLTLSSLPDRLGHARVLYPAVGSLVAGMAMLATTDRVADLVVAAALAGTGHAFIFPILSGMVVERAPQVDRGSGIGVFTATFDVATITGVPVLGAVIERVGYPAMFVAVAVVVVAGAVLFLRGERALAVEEALAPA
jgi:predicted MFS family arabinose efflux permease